MNSEEGLCWVVGGGKRLGAVIWNWFSCHRGARPAMSHQTWNDSDKCGKVSKCAGSINFHVLQMWITNHPSKKIFVTKHTIKPLWDQNWGPFWTDNVAAHFNNTNKNDYRRISLGHNIPFGDSQDIISFHYDLSNPTVCKFIVNRRILQYQYYFD